MNQPNNSKINYFIYARKSSESEDRQMSSIEDQIKVLKKLAGDRNLQVVEVLSEAHSAKIPGGRPVFNKMLERIYAGEAQGIIAWKLNRLARNPVDGGQISWMLQQSTIQHIVTSDRGYFPTDNVLMMAVELGMANQFLRDLSTDTKRGLRQKAERGWYPVYATLGYTHNPNKKKGEKEMICDPERFDFVRKMFDLMLTGRYSPRKIWEIAVNDWGLTTRRGNKISLSFVYRIFSDPFYYGEFEFPKGSGNWIKGNHQPMITKKEFDQIQIFLHRKTNPRPRTHEFAYSGTMICGECGATITPEAKVKRQQNGNVHYYTYYHCTWKRDPNCSQGSIEEKELEKQISQVLSEIKLPNGFCEWALDVLRDNNVVEAHTRDQAIENQRAEYDKVTKKIDRLLDMRLKDELTEDEFATKKLLLLKEKHELERRLGDIQQRSDNWLDEAGRHLEFARTAKDVFDTTESLDVKKGILMFLGSNLVLKDKKLSIDLRKPLQHIKEASEGLRNAIERSEPRKNLGNKERNDDFYSSIPIMLPR